jgi:predicted RND superfamily exporter protein
MEGLNSTIMGILLVWGVVTAILVALVVYRGTIEIREDDQIFLGSSGSGQAREQQEIISKVEKLAMPIKLLTISSVILLLIAGGAKLYEGFQSF